MPPAFGDASVFRIDHFAFGNARRFKMDASEALAKDLLSAGLQGRTGGEAVRLRVSRQRGARRPQGLRGGQ
eukprot:1407728-Pyramimonas_sp.AAC.1